MESVLMTAFLMLYPNDCERDDDCSAPPVMCGKSRRSEKRAFRLLSSVCSYWHLTLAGWPESPTSQWVRHQIKRLIERKNLHNYKYYVLYHSCSDLHLKISRYILETYTQIVIWIISVFTGQSFMMCDIDWISPQMHRVTLLVEIGCIGKVQSLSKSTENCYSSTIGAYTLRYMGQRCHNMSHAIIYQCDRY